MNTSDTKRVIFSENDFLVSKTDLKGRLTYCNQSFIKAAGYSESELIGKPHNIVRHPDMPKSIFKLLWDRIQSGNEIFAFVKNKTKDGGYYWVYANVTTSTDSSGKAIGYYSVRRKVNENALQTIENLYSKLISIEKNQNMTASEKYLNKILEEKGISYDEYISSLQG